MTTTNHRDGTDPTVDPDLEAAVSERMRALLGQGSESDLLREQKLDLARARRGERPLGGL